MGLSGVPHPTHLPQPRSAPCQPKPPAHTYILESKFGRYHVASSSRTCHNKRILSRSQFLHRTTLNPSQHASHTTSRACVSATARLTETSLSSWPQGEDQSWTRRSPATDILLHQVRLVWWRACAAHQQPPPRLRGKLRCFGIRPLTVTKMPA